MEALAMLARFVELTNFVLLYSILDIQYDTFTVVDDEGVHATNL